MVNQWSGPREGTTQLTTDDLLRALASQPRRILLFHLRQNGVAPVDELVDVVYDLADVERAVGDRDRRRLHRVLVDHHIPYLERLGLVVAPVPTRVELASAPETFGAWLDLAVRRELETSTPAQVDADEETPQMVTILLVDDEPDLAEVVGEILMKHNDDFQVVTAETAPDAYGLLQEVTVDCIVSDYLMPAIDGLDFLTAVREEYPNLPFVLFTNKGSEEVAIEAIDREVTAYVQKSEDTDRYDRLATQIRAAVAKHG